MSCVYYIEDFGYIDLSKICTISDMDINDCFGIDLVGGCTFHIKDGKVGNKYNNLVSAWEDL